MRSDMKVLACPCQKWQKICWSWSTKESALVSLVRLFSSRFGVVLLDCFFGHVWDLADLSTRDHCLR